MKRIIIILLLSVLLINCQKILTKIEFKDKIIVPEKSFRLNESILKSNGYYYCKKEMKSYCKSVSNGRGQKLVLESEYREKYIITMIIYDNGSFFYPRNMIFSGIDSIIRSRLDYCNQLNNNNHKSAIGNFEKYVEETNFESNTSYNNGILKKGVYNIYDKKMVMQSYQGWITSQYTIEQDIEIVNDTTFVIESMKIYESNESEILNDTFHFKEFNMIPKPISYILENREKFGK